MVSGKSCSEPRYMNAHPRERATLPTLPTTVLGLRDQGFLLRLIKLNLPELKLQTRSGQGVYP